MSNKVAKGRIGDNTSYIEVISGKGRVYVEIYDGAYHTCFPIDDPRTLHLLIGLLQGANGAFTQEVEAQS